MLLGQALLLAATGFVAGFLEPVQNFSTSPFWLQVFLQFVK